MGQRGYGKMERRMVWMVLASFVALSSLARAAPAQFPSKAQLQPQGTTSPEDVQTGMEIIPTLEIWTRSSIFMPPHITAFLNNLASVQAPSVQAPSRRLPLSNESTLPSSDKNRPAGTQYKSEKPLTQNSNEVFSEHPWEQPDDNLVEELHKLKTKHINWEDGGSLVEQLHNLKTQQINWKDVATNKISKIPDHNQWFRFGTQ